MGTTKQSPQRYLGTIQLAQGLHDEEGEFHHRRLIGFWRHLAEKLRARGDRVAVTVHQKYVLDDLKSQYGDRLWIANLDLTHTDAVRDVIDRAFADLGRIDVVYSNAGYGLFGAAEEVTDEQVRHQIDTNFLGSIAVIRACLPHLRAQGGGRVQQVSSEGGQVTYANFGAGRVYP